jgi:predicted ester cyclase
MGAVSVDTRQLIRGYFTALSGRPKTEELIDRFVSDPGLKEHIRAAEAAFPEYELIAHEIVAEGDLVAVRGAFRGIHEGDFAGIKRTGRRVTVDLMIFYRIADDRVAEHWMQLDMKGLLDQLTS